MDRTTNGKGDVTQKSLAEIRRLDAGSWMGPCFAGERVPTLDEMLALLKDSGCRPVIEIKGQGIAEKVVAAVRAAAMVDQAVVISFHKDAVKAVRTLEPRIACAWLCDKVPEDVPVGKQVDWIVGQARQCGTNFVDLSHEMLSADTVAQLQRRGMTVWVWTVDDPNKIDELIRWGVAGITTNRPNVVQQHLLAVAQGDDLWPCRFAAAHGGGRTPWNIARARESTGPSSHARTRIAARGARQPFGRAGRLTPNRLDLVCGHALGVGGQARFADPQDARATGRCGRSIRTAWR